MNDLTYTMSGSKHPTDSLARGLGWFSIGLGLYEMFAPRQITRRLGMHGRERLIRAYGARKLVNGMGLLSATQRAPWLWARVAGDAVDIGTLAPLCTRFNPYRRNATAALGAVVGVTIADIAGATALSAQQARGKLTRDYSDRSGFPRSPEQMRGIARRETTRPAPPLSDAVQPWANNKF